MNVATYALFRHSIFTYSTTTMIVYFTFTYFRFRIILYNNS